MWHGVELEQGSVDALYSERDVKKLNGIRGVL
jgi:hypothetical protein